MAFDSNLKRVEARSSRLCDHCQVLDFNDEKLGGFIGKADDGTLILEFDEVHEAREFPLPWESNDYLPGLPRMKHSAENGCQFCEFLRNCIIRAGVTHPKGRGNVFIYLKYLWGVDRTNLVRGGRQDGLLALAAHVWGDYQSDDAARLASIYFAIGSDDERLTKWLRMDRPPNLRVLCPENIEFMRKVIRRCCDIHHCSVEVSDFVPTRLLDLGETPEDTPVLIVTANYPQTIKTYAALSYCWGPQPDADLQLKTEESTLRDRLLGVPTSIMSPVMRDAIEVCRVLLIRYLWIDSLCIIQDQYGDAIDWNRESEVMGKIFQNAHITICAVSSASCQQGFLNRSVRKLPISYKSRLNPSVFGTYWLIDVGNHQGLSSPLFFDLYKSAWYRRGWVFQEHNLSSRMLLFGDRMLHFQCSMGETSENGYEMTVSFPQLIPGRIRHLRSGNWLSGEDLFDFRRRMAVYASSNLKFRTDRLPAIAGLAKLQSEYLDDEYLAGIWKGELHIALLWSPVNPLQSQENVISARQPSKDRIAPSWSWACQNRYFEEGVGSIDANLDRHLCAEYYDMTAKIVPDGASLFGKVRSGMISLTTKIRRLPSDLHLSDHGAFYGIVDEVWNVRQGPAYVAHCRLDWVTGLRGQGVTHSSEGLWMVLVSSSCAGETRCASSQREQRDNENVSLYGVDGNEDVDNYKNINNDSSAHLSDCLRCGDSLRNRHAWGLLLHESEEPGKFIRVGIFTSRASEVGGTRFFTGVELSAVHII